MSNEITIGNETINGEYNEHFKKRIPNKFRRIK